MAPVLKRRGSLEPNAYVFGSPSGEFVADFKTAWESLLLIRQRARDEAREARCTCRSRQAAADRPALARPPSRGRVSPPGGARGHPHDSADARPCRHQADAAVPEHHGRRTAESDDRCVGTPASTEGGRSVRLKPATTDESWGEPVNELEAPPNVHGLSMDPSKSGAPGRTRTCDPRLRRPVLYPTELRARAMGRVQNGSIDPLHLSGDTGRETMCM